MPSTLYALDRALITSDVAANMLQPELKRAFLQQRPTALANANRARAEQGISPGEQTVFVGSEAIENYIDFPEEGYFVKSPKSFLGVNGLRAEQIYLFEDIVTAMMQQIKRQAQLSTQADITQVVIGRPVNFQGMGGETSNAQALDILRIAAKRAGFIDIEFLYEPLAAGIDFETKLSQDQTVLVVDIGGGTTDCSMVKMGPSHCVKSDRSQDFLAHTGQRIGGNDIDIYLSYKAFMPLMGLDSYYGKGLQLPSEPFWNAVKTNDIPAQTEFNSLRNTQLLAQLLRDAHQPELLKRLVKLQQHKTNHQLLRSAEQAKIQLSSQPQISVDLSFIEARLQQQINTEFFAAAITRPLSLISNLIKEAVLQAQCEPDLVYITGGSAKSPVIQHAIKQQVGDIPIMDGDHFGSVATGLTTWAQTLYR